MKGRKRLTNCKNENSLGSVKFTFNLHSRPQVAGKTTYYRVETLLRTFATRKQLRRVFETGVGHSAICATSWTLSSMHMQINGKSQNDWLKFLLLNAAINHRIRHDFCMRQGAFGVQHWLA